MRTKLLLGVVASAAALTVVPQASASHHVDCAPFLREVCAVINHTVFCHELPPPC